MEYFLPGGNENYAVASDVMYISGPLFSELLLRYGILYSKLTYYINICTSLPTLYTAGPAEITYPDNGQVLDTGDFAIKIKLTGYEIPSQFHGSTICVGLTNGVDTFTEKCFEQVQCSGLAFVLISALINVLELAFWPHF